MCSYAWNLSVVCFKVKKPYLTSITCNSISTDKAEVDGGLISPTHLPPSPLHQCSILWVFEATQNRKKLKQGCEIRGSNLGPHAQRRCTNRLYHLCSWKMFLLENIDIWKWVNLNDSVFLILLFILTHLKMIIILSWVIFLMSLCSTSLVFCIWSRLFWKIWTMRIILWP